VRPLGELLDDLGGAERRKRGYTALSRHTTEARFYVSATPAFLNRSDQSLHVGRGTTRQIARMLGASRAQRLALDGTTPDPQRSLIVDELDEARRYLATIDAEVAALERARTTFAGTSAAGGTSFCVASMFTGSCSGAAKRTSSA
jgi:CRP-like cAMP-binding protein